MEKCPKCGAAAGIEMVFNVSLNKFEKEVFCIHGHRFAPTGMEAKPKKGHGARVPGDELHISREEFERYSLAELADRYGYSISSIERRKPEDLKDPTRVRCGKMWGKMGVEQGGLTHGDNPGLHSV